MTPYTKVRRLILQAIMKRKTGITTFELAKKLRMPMHCISGRVSELCSGDKPRVRDSGNVRKNPDSGVYCKVWEVVG